MNKILLKELEGKYLAGWGSVFEAFEYNDKIYYLSVYTVWATKTNFYTVTDGNITIEFNAIEISEDNPNNALFARYQYLNKPTYSRTNLEFAVALTAEFNKIVKTVIAQNFEDERLRDEAF